MYEERVERKRKSWGSSLRSVSVGSGGARWGESSSRSAIFWGKEGWVGWLGWVVVRRMEVSMVVMQKIGVQIWQEILVD